MTDIRTTEYIEKLKSLSMSSEAKLRMREELSSFADFHGVRITEGNRSNDEVQNRSVLSLFIHSHTRIMKATLLMALMVTVGGGTSFAAQNALPGDALYPVKLHVNEAIKTSVTVDANAQAELQLALLNERIEEAKTLSGEGMLHGDMEAQVLARIAAQVDKTTLAANSADAEVGANVRLAIDDELSSLSTRLAVVSPQMENRTVAQADARTSIASKFGMGGGAAADVMTMSAVGTELAGEINVADIVAQAQTRLTALQNTIRTAVGMSAEVKADFEARLKTAGEFVTLAHAELTAGAQAKAEEEAQKAHEIMGEVESSLSLLGNVQIDMNTGHIIGIDLFGNTSSGAGVSGSAGASGSIEPDIMIGNDAAVDNMINIEGGESIEGTFGF